MKPAIKTTQTDQSPTQKDKRFHVLDITMKRSQYRQNSLIEVLHKAQASFGYLDKAVLTYVARELKLPLSRVYGVATFYHLFFLEPNGVHTCVVCLGTACYVKGSDKILASLEKETGISAGETTEDGQISLLTARCLGACGIAPAIIFDDTVAGQQTSHTACKRIQQWQAEKQQ
jgi:bidirectional [NiFe] hydrogenase diaphorase subunit